MEVIPVLIISLLTAMIFFYVRRILRRPFDADYLKSLLKEMDAKIAQNPHDPALNLVHAELQLRTGSPNAALRSLEQAYIFGTRWQDFEPTFWACYSEITHCEHVIFEQVEKPHTQIWRNIELDAPTFSKKIAENRLTHDVPVASIDFVYQRPPEALDKEYRDDLINRYIAGKSVLLEIDSKHGPQN